MKTLSANKRIEIQPGAVGTILSKENVQVSGDVFAIMDIRNTLGRKALFLTSSIVRSNEEWDAPVEIHIANHSPNLVEILEGEEIVNIMLVKAHKPEPTRQDRKNLLVTRLSHLTVTGVSFVAYSNKDASIVVTKCQEDFCYNVKVSGKEVHGLDINLCGLNPTADTILNHVAILEHKG